MKKLRHLLRFFGRPKCFEEGHHHTRTLLLLIGKVVFLDMFADADLGELLDVDEVAIMSISVSHIAKLFRWPAEEWLAF